MVARGQITATLAAVLLALWSAPAGADPLAEAVTVEVKGSCPGRFTLVNALDQEGVELDARARWTVRVVSRDARARLDLIRPGGGRAAVRIIDSDDCAAVAEAFALIVSAGLAAAPAPPAAVPAMVPELAPPSLSAERAAPRPAAGRAVWGGVLGGVSFASPNNMTGQVDAGFAAGGVLIRGLFRINNTSEYLTFDGDRIVVGAKRRQSSLLGEVGASYRRGRWWAAPWLGVGASISRVTSRQPGTAMTTSVLRVHPAVSGTGEVGIDVTPRVSLRGTVGAMFFPINDRYLIPDGRQFESPRVQLVAGLGVTFQLGRSASEP